MPAYERVLLTATLVAATAVVAIVRRRRARSSNEPEIDDVVGGGDDGECGLDLSRRVHRPIPIVDLSLPDAEIVAALTAACTYPGFFYLVGLPASTLPTAAAALEAARVFFRLPIETKRSIANDEAVQYRVRDSSGQTHFVPGSGNGWRAAGGDVHFATDLRESFNFGREALAPGEKELPYGNVWPDEQALPGFRAALLAHERQMLDLAVRLRRLLAQALGERADYFCEPGWFDRSTHQTGMVWYQPKLSQPQSGVFGIRPHADGGAFTLLFTDGSPGLHICPDKRRGASAEWVPVPARADALVVNLGTELERLSNGRFKATLHCVVNESGRERLSLPFFYETNIDAKIAPVPATLASGEPPRFAPATPEERLLAGLRLQGRRV